MFLFVFFVANVYAFTTTETEVSDTLSTFSITQANNLYAYEINLDYSGTVSAQQYNILGSTSQATYGTNSKNGVFSVYGSILNSTSPGVNVSGNIFNVTHSGDLSLRYTLEVYKDGTETYTYYNISASPTTDTGTSGGGGSGGGGGAGQFTVSPSLLKVMVTQGETVTETVSITNKLNSVLEVSPSADENLRDFVVFDETSITLLPGETKSMEVHFFAKTDEVPEVYTGAITFESSGTTKAVSTIVEVKEKKPLFDVTVDLDKTEYSPGDNVIAIIQLENFGELRNIDVLLYYALKDFEGNVLMFKEESYAIENYKLQIVGKLKIPEDAEPNDYIFYAKTSYGNVIATGSQVFSVDNVGFSPTGIGKTFLYILVPLVAIIILVVTLILYLKTRKKYKSLATQ